MKKICTLVVFTLLAVLPALPTTVRAATPHYATFHADQLFVTPYRLQTASRLASYIVAGPGEQYLIVSLTAVNHNDVELVTSAREFHVVAADGTVGDPTFETRSPVFGGVTLVPGATTKGTISFEVPKGSHTATLRWGPQSPWIGVSWPEYSWALTF